MRPLPSVVRFNHLLGQISKTKHKSVVISLFNQMGLLGIMPDFFTLNILINCFCHLNHMGFSLCVLGKFVKSSYAPDTVTLNTLMNGFLLEGKVGED